MPVVNNGPGDEEDAVSGIGEHASSGPGALHLGKRQVTGVQNAEVTRHQSPVTRHDGELASVREVGRRFDRRKAGGRSHEKGGESSGSIEGPAPVMVPAVQSPTGLVQFWVTNSLWIVPCTGIHSWLTTT